MSLTVEAPMTYEKNIGTKKTGKVAGKLAKKTIYRDMDYLGTPAILFFLVKRHKLGLLAIGNVILVLNWMFPAWPELVKSLI